MYYSHSYVCKYIYFGYISLYVCTYSINVKNVFNFGNFKRKISKDNLCQTKKQTKKLCINGSKNSIP